MYYAGQPRGLFAMKRLKMVMAEKKQKQKQSRKRPPSRPKARRKKR
jgi:hypothetical protein